MDGEQCATEATARTLRLVADMQTAEVVSAIAGLDQRRTLLRYIRDTVTKAVTKALEDVYDDAEKQQRNEEASILCDDLDAKRLELEALRAAARAEKICQRRETKSE